MSECRPEYIYWTFAMMERSLTAVPERLLAGVLGMECVKYTIASDGCSIQ